MSLIKDICRKHSLSVTEVFTAGHVCPAVYKAQDRYGKPVVVKVGNNTATIQEIAKNLEGYKMLKKIGLDCICPNIYFAEVRQESALIVMEYCGKDLHSTLEISLNPETVFHELVSQLKNVYKSSVRTESPVKSIQMVLSKILEQYDMYLATVFDRSYQLQSVLDVLPSRINIEAFRLSCFSSWDFTPRNVFLTKNGLKYIDCNDNVMGIPIIDLACFAGVVKDIHSFPGSIDGYDFLANFAVDEIADMLEIDPVQSLRLFYLGRLLQLFLGARFRINTDPILAKKFYENAVEFLKKITA